MKEYSLEKYYYAPETSILHVINKAFDSPRLWLNWLGTWVYVCVSSSSTWSKKIKKKKGLACANQQIIKKIRLMSQK